jgi:hypothetical protein
MRFESEANHGANNGLNIARDLMEKVKQEFPWISYGDLWTLAGVAAIQVWAQNSVGFCISRSSSLYVIRKWLDPTSLGAQDALMDLLLRLPPTVVFPMLLKVLTISGIFSIAWGAYFFPCHKVSYL